MAFIFSLEPKANIQSAFDNFKLFFLGFLDSFHFSFAADALSIIKCYQEFDEVIVAPVFSFFSRCHNDKVQTGKFFRDVDFRDFIDFVT